MVDKKNPVTSLEEALQTSRRERNKKLAQEMLGTNPQKLAQEMLGSKSRTTSTPRAIQAPASLASRAGVTKRSTSLSRSHTAPLRNSRQPSHLSRPSAPDDSSRTRAVNPIRAADTVGDAARNNGYPGPDGSNGGPELNIRGAARGPWIVHASNFAPGTTAADIESVMERMGGKMHYCQLVASSPTVIAEMSFVEQEGAEKVIDMFNNKKADGRVLYVYYADVPEVPNEKAQRQQAHDSSLSGIVDTTGDGMMEVDEHAEAREVENRQREERRGRDARGSDQRYSRDDYYRRGGREVPEYQEGGYGFGSDRRYGGGGGGGGRYRNEGRMYSDSVRRSGQSYRP